MTLPRRPRGVPERSIRPRSEALVRGLLAPAELVYHGAVLTIRDAQLEALQQSINASTVLPRLLARFAAMGLLRAGDRSADARVLADVREAQALGLMTEPALAQYASYGFTFPAWQSRPELASILAQPGLTPDARLRRLHEALSAL